ncbi:MAG: glucan biosynthesis protein G [Gammaproteobacteria bacterium]|nr:glucan biosynthesis protein G [Gammaproteobacteria bacterium]MBU1441159.1 glucan biosynthesis protein G [Gammaproteobacteria bacterium]MBU2408012.1 glucan biosynthesis protein G [Gammaproteobacteria bacterium]
MLIAPSAAHAQTAAAAFSLDDVAARAKALAAAPYAAPVSNLPPTFSSMQFADYMKIQARPDRFEWNDADTPFRLGFYHQGMQFNAPVRINEITGSAVREIPYQPERFDFGGLNIDKQSTQQLGYAGFRVLYPINEGGKFDEVMSLLGASYFRVIGKGQVYGLSSRGLAIDTTSPGSEEFPRFREYWVQRPAPRDRQLVIYALLDSPRATGAYRFVLTPGSDSTLDVQSRIFLRGDAGTLGIAPLTSMFLYGPNQRWPEHLRNFRPAIHDSNGLAIHAGNDEWIWRPLNNPRAVAVSTFEVDNPKGFGLLQRGHAFHHFEDLKDRYDLRPSAWIEPQGNWGKGRVTLMEIPTADETNDNIVAFWSPETPARAGQMLQFAYRMHWTMDEKALHASNNAWVKQTFQSEGEQLQPNLIRALDGSTALMVDFEGPAVANLPPGTALEPQVSVNANADLLETQLQPNPVIKGWRLKLHLRVKDPSKATELRAALAQGGKPVSETWSFQIPPVPPPPAPAPAPSAAPAPATAPPVAPGTATPLPAPTRPAVVSPAPVEAPAAARQPAGVPVFPR